MSIVVTTPTGNIGHVVVRDLLAAGEDVTVIARNPDKLAPEVREKAKVVAGEHLDPATLIEATRGATALFWLTPPNFQAEDWKAFIHGSGETAAGAIRANGIPYVVHLSSAGADRPTGFGPVSFVHGAQRALASTGANVLELRPGYFYENFFAMLEQIATGDGNVYYPMPGETRYPLIATRDIGIYAARRLRERDWAGETVEGLHGPAEQPTFAEAASILGEAVGRKVNYVGVPVEAARPQFEAMGASESVIVAYTELLETVAGGAQPTEARTERTTTPTTLAEWARDTFRPAFEARMAHAKVG